MNLPKHNSNEEGWGLGGKEEIYRLKLISRKVEQSCHCSAEIPGGAAMLLFVTCKKGYYLAPLCCVEGQVYGNLWKTE